MFKGILGLPFLLGLSGPVASEKTASYRRSGPLPSAYVCSDSALSGGRALSPQLFSLWETRYPL